MCIIYIFLSSRNNRALCRDRERQTAAMSSAPYYVYRNTSGIPGAMVNRELCRVPFTYAGARLDPLIKFTLELFSHFNWVFGYVWLYLCIFTQLIYGWNIQEAVFIAFDTFHVGGLEKLSLCNSHILNRVCTVLMKFLDVFYLFFLCAYIKIVWTYQELFYLISRQLPWKFPECDILTNSKYHYVVNVSQIFRIHETRSSAEEARVWRDYWAILFCFDNIPKWHSTKINSGFTAFI